MDCNVPDWEADKLGDESAQNFQSVKKTKIGKNKSKKNVDKDEGEKDKESIKKITNDLKKLIEAESKGNLKEYMDGLKEKNKSVGVKGKTILEKVEQRKKKGKTKREKMMSKIESGDVFGVEKSEGKIEGSKKKDVLNEEEEEGWKRKKKGKDVLNGEESKEVKGKKKRKEVVLNGEEVVEEEREDIVGKKKKKGIVLNAEEEVDKKKKKKGLNGVEGVKVEREEIMGEKKKKGVVLNEEEEEGQKRKKKGKNKVLNGEEVVKEESEEIKGKKKEKKRKKVILNGQDEEECGEKNGGIVEASESKKKGKKRKLEGSELNGEETMEKKKFNENAEESGVGVNKKKKKQKKKKPEENPAKIPGKNLSEFSNVSSLTKTNKIIKFYDDGTTEEQSPSGPAPPPKLHGGKTIFEILNSNPPKKKVKPQDLPLRERMMQRLKAARFRYLNEQIYTTESKDIEVLFKEDPSAFLVYHEGYKQQVRKWPMNPLDNIIESIKKLPKSFVVADFGCGEGKLAKSVEHKVHSFDLVAADDSITACDMKNVPLKSNSVDVVVFCLSLMGTNLNEYLLEANRVLKVNGILKIAEVESRFDAVDNFIDGVKCYGFKNSWKDLSHNLFYFMDFKKERDIKKKNKLPTIGLHPCLYKRR